MSSIQKWRQWVRQPQSLALRKALFQIHLWCGLGIGIYVILISVTGSVIVFRNELFTFFTAEPVVVDARGQRLTEDALRERATHSYPGYYVSQFFENKEAPREAIEIWMEREVGVGSARRLFNPYSGEDLGNSVPTGIYWVSLMSEFHVDLLNGDSGRYVNTAGAVLWTMLGMTGCVVWWPGIQAWRRSLTLSRKAGWKRFNWDLHSAMGIWSAAFILMWGITGIYSALPAPFRAFVDYMDPPTDASYGIRFGDRFLRMVSRVHFGSFAGMPTKIIWCIVGFAPVILFITGVIMWWNRVLRKKSLGI